MAETAPQLLAPTDPTEQRQSFLRYLLGSLAAITPCFWQSRIQAGDLGSHTYNVWLAQWLRAHPVAGLEIHRQWSNVLFDQILEALAKVFGIFAAEKITVALCVLVFFWGAFRLCSLGSDDPPWRISPAVLMVTYGLTFNMGFMNYFLAIGLSFWAIALCAHQDRRQRVAGLLLLPLIFFAHYLGFVWACAGILYMTVTRRGGLRARVALTAAALGILVASRFYLAAHFTVAWSRSSALQRAGADQLMLGSHYGWIGYAFLATLVIAILIGIVRGGQSAATPQFIAIGGLYAVVMAGALLLPDGLMLPQYPAPVFFLSSRLTLIAAVLLIALAAQVKVPAWSTVAFALLAIVFFAQSWSDGKLANALEAQTSQLVRTLPAGSRFIAADVHLRSNTIFEHFVDRACIDHCFMFGNYEPSSGQFRVRATAPNPIVEWNADAADAMGSGEYLVRPEDIPIYRLDPCPDGTPRFCATALQPGEQSGR